MPRRKSSFIWQHFEKDKQGEQAATCLRCKKVYRTCGNTSNLRTHLNRTHNITEDYMPPEEASFCLSEDEAKGKSEMGQQVAFFIENMETVECSASDVLHSGVENCPSLQIPQEIQEIKVNAPCSNTFSQEPTSRKSLRKRMKKEPCPATRRKLENDFLTKHQPTANGPDKIDVFMRYIGNRMRQIRNQIIRNKLEDTIIDVVREACNDDDEN